MMVVITLSKCPIKLRGDLSKWLIEIDTGVFVGNLSARVRDAVWERLCENIKDGRASMAFGTNGEQKLDFRIHNSDWEPVDYDGLRLIRRNAKITGSDGYKNRSTAVIDHINRAKRKSKSLSDCSEYVVIDIETTGVKDSDKIIELAALRIKEGDIDASFSELVLCDFNIPDEIVKLTGITNEVLRNEGIPLKCALIGFIGFCGNSLLVGHNIKFDIGFIQRACVICGLPIMMNRTVDTVRMVKKKNISVKDYKLSTIADHFGMDLRGSHRAKRDCQILYRIYEKLKEI